jgi:hypothetical protein
MNMRISSYILTVVIGCLTSCTALGPTEAPPSSPEELGKRVAQALLAGDTHGIASCLPSVVAYTPVMQAFAAEGHTSPDAMRAYHDREVKDMMELVAMFPREVEHNTGLSVADVRSTVVDVCKTNSVFTDVILTFKTDHAAYKMRLDECMKYSNHWYVIDFDWMGREKNSEPTPAGDRLKAPPEE